VFENRVSEENEVTGDWRKLQIEELHNFYSSPSIISMMKSRRMRWAEHEVRMGEKRECINVIGMKARKVKTTGKTKA
jgi:hypothetical protein